MPVVFKIKSGEDTRRISLDREPSFDELKQIVRQLFNIPLTFILKYEDDEKDLITISSDIELSEALQVSSKCFNGIVRLSVIEKSQQQIEKDSQPPLSGLGLPPQAWSPFTAQDLRNTIQDLKLASNSGSADHQTLVQLMNSFPWVQEAVVNLLMQNLAPTKTHQQPQPQPEIKLPANNVVPPLSASTLSTTPHLDTKSKKNRKLAKFIKDVTIADGTVFAPQTAFVKTWRIRNDGQSKWPDQTILCNVGGDPLGASAVPVAPVLPGQEVEISVPMVAPSLPGRYNSFWRLRGPDGKFGHRLWADIIVKEPQAIPVIEEPASVVQTPLPLSPSLPSGPLQEPVTPQIQAPTLFQFPEGPLFTPWAPIVAPLQTVDLATPLPQQDSPTDDHIAVDDTTDTERAILVTLQDMGFKGDLLAILRKNGGDFMSTLNELM